MKRSEVIRRAREVACEPPRTVFLGDDVLVDLATALGIEVEPDEEPLPDRLEYYAGGTSIDGIRPGYSYRRTVGGITVRRLVVRRAARRPPPRIRLAPSLAHGGAGE